jgi:hypothetical protein
MMPPPPPPPGEGGVGGVGGEGASGVGGGRRIGLKVTTVFGANVGDFVGADEYNGPSASKTSMLVARQLGGLETRCRVEAYCAWYELDCARPESDSAGCEPESKVKMEASRRKAVGLRVGSFVGLVGLAVGPTVGSGVVGSKVGLELAMGIGVGSKVEFGVGRTVGVGVGRAVVGFGVGNSVLGE